MLTAITKLDAINIILSAIGADPVNTIDTEIDVDVANACRHLDKASRDIQRKGWDFNTYHLTLESEAFSQRIPWIPTIIAHKATDGGSYAKRGDWFYDIQNQTFEFSHPITIDAVMAVDFDDLPDSFKNYITAKAALDFQAHYMGDTTVAQDLAYALQEAYQEIVAYDMNMQDTNMLNMTGVQPALERN